MHLHKMIITFHGSSKTRASSHDCIPLPLQVGHGPAKAAPPQLGHNSPFCIPVPPQARHVRNPLPLHFRQIGMFITSP